MAYDAAVTAPHSISIDDTFFANTDSVNCPLTSCTLHAAGACAGSASTSTDVTLTQSGSSWTLEAITNSISGYVENVCLRCQNRDQIIDVDNWKFQLGSCTAAFTYPSLVGVIASTDLGYGGVSAADYTAVHDFDTLFGNTDVAKCPITSCTMGDNDCTGIDLPTAYPNFSNEFTLDLVGSDWTVTAK